VGPGPGDARGGPLPHLRVSAVSVVVWAMCVCLCVLLLVCVCAPRELFILVRMLGSGVTAACVRDLLLLLLLPPTVPCILQVAHVPRRPLYPSPCSYAANFVSNFQGFDPKYLQASSCW
jgi:hypothetical protein